MKEDKIMRWLVGLACVALIILGVKSLMPTSIAPYFGGSSTSPSYYRDVTNTTTSVALTATQVVAANAYRRYLLIQNLGENDVHCLLEGDTAAASSKVSATSSLAGYFGFRIQGIGTSTVSRAGSDGSVFILADSYTGAVNCSGNSGTSVVFVSEAK